MNTQSAIPYSAAFLCALLMVAALVRRRHSVANWSFVAGMVLLALENLFSGLALSAGTMAELMRWQHARLLASASLLPVWLCFSLSFSRGNYRDFLFRWRWVLLAAFVVPMVVTLGFAGEILSPPAEETGIAGLSGAGRALTGIFLLVSVLILTNLERTFRAAVGTMLWRIKFVVLGVALIFGTRVYTASQALLFSRQDAGLVMIEALAVAVGCVLVGVAYLRTGLAESDIYPSRAAIQSSVTIVVAGAYLFVVGVLAQIAAAAGAGENFQLQALIVLVGLAGLAALLLSDRLRGQLRRFVSRHFKRPHYDFRKLWSTFTQALSSAVDEPGICNAAVQTISSTFGTLSVSIWLFDESRERLVLLASTSTAAGTDLERPAVELPAPAAVEPAVKQAFNLEKTKHDWAAALRDTATSHFPVGGDRLCLPLFSRDHWLGAAILADRVSGVPYTAEEVDLLQCVADQIASALLNARLTAEIVRGREVEAFRTMSTFFVHDLKNVASTLTLMLKNLPLHFDNPEFRQDALRGIGKTVDRMNELISRLGALRRKLTIHSAPLDLNQLVDETLRDTTLPGRVQVRREADAVPSVTGDAEQLKSVVTNLLLNAADAVGSTGEVVVQTSSRPGWAMLSVVDTGCGMPPEFLRHSLFRPFHSTKKNGLGIGMFQSKMIVEAHGGSVQVKSEVGSGTTFTVALPAHTPAA